MCWTKCGVFREEFAYLLVEAWINGWLFLEQWEPPRGEAARSVTLQHTQREKNISYLLKWCHQELSPQAFPCNLSSDLMQVRWMKIVRSFSWNWHEIQPLTSQAAVELWRENRTPKTSSIIFNFIVHNQFSHKDQMLVSYISAKQGKSCM